MRSDWHASLHSWWIQDEEDKLVSVEILNTETGQLVPGPDMPQHKTFAAAAVNNELLVFANRNLWKATVILAKSIRCDKGSQTQHGKRLHSLYQTKHLFLNLLLLETVLCFRANSVYDTKRDCWWNLPTYSISNYFRLDIVGETEIIAFTDEGIYSLKLKLSVEPPTATMLRHTKTCA